MPRKKSIEPVIQTFEVPPVSNIITNTRKGFTLHLGDGRSLAFGESVEVGAEQAADLRERGLAE